MPKAAAKEKKAKAPAKEKAKKDSGAPKKPLTAYFIYQNEVRPQIKEDNPDMGFGDVSKMIGKQWKALTDKEKEPYMKQAADAKKEYEKGGGAKPAAKAKKAKEPEPEPEEEGSEGLSEDGDEEDD